MKLRNIMNRTTADWMAGAMALAVMLGVAAVEVRAQGGSGSVPNLVVYEGYDYYVGTEVSINGQNGGFGFGGAWVRGGWSRDMIVGLVTWANGAGTTINEDRGLEFPGLPVEGSAVSRFGSAGQIQAHRPLAAGALAELTRDDTTIWFSVLLGSSTGERTHSFIFGDNRFVAGDATADPPDGSGAFNGPGQGFGVTTRAAGGWAGSGSINAMAFVNSSSPTIDTGSFTPTLQSGGTHHDTALIVGKINWKAVGTPDELFLFNVTDVRLDEPDESEAIASLSADLDQSTFDRIAIHDSGSSILDEIRIGTTYGSVLGWPAPGATLIGIR